MPRHFIGLNIVLGVWLIATALAAPNTSNAASGWIHLFAGLLLVCCSALVLADIPSPRLWSSCAMLCGAWLVIASVLVSDNDRAVHSDVIVGALILAISGLEVWRSGIPARGT
jgi:phosphatidylserine synthase